MLPECRQEEHFYMVPHLDLTTGDTAPFKGELRGFHEEFRDCFRRSETREHIFQYSVGQFSNLQRKSIEPIAINIEGGQVRPMQHAISNSIWNEDKMLKILHGMIEEDMGDPNGAVIFDESGFIKKGKDSAGGGRQYSGNIGKVDNCQVGVYGSYVSPAGYTFLDKRLFIQESWFSDAYSEKREKCQFPNDLEFTTKPRLAVEMLKKIYNEKIISFKYVLGDSIYGQSPDFIEAIENMAGKTYFVAVSSDTRIWLKAPLTAVKDYKYKGKTYSKKILKDKAKTKAPVTAMEFARSLNDFFWYRRTVSEGTKGPIEYEFAKRKVTLAKNGVPDKKVWMIFKRTTGKNPEYSFYISNASASTKLATFVWLSGLRWSIEQCFEEAKTELGMSQYEIRKYNGWNHHMLLTILSHYYLWHLKIKLGKKSSSTYYRAA